MEQISLVKSWLREAGAHNVLVTSAVNNNWSYRTFCLAAYRRRLLLISIGSQMRMMTVIHR
nr:hypothetical protein [Escherichia coli]